MLKPHRPPCQMHVCHQQNPWQINDGLILGKWSSTQNQPLASSITRIIYDKCLKNPSKAISPGPHRIPNDILKTLPKSFHNMFHLFFLHYYLQKEIQSPWKHNTTILLHKKDNPTIIINYRPIALACTIYTLLTTLYIPISECGKVVKVILNSSTQWISATKRSYIWD